VRAPDGAGAGEEDDELRVGVLAGEETGEGFAPAGEVCVAGWSFISSRRNALLATLWCA
jgi:hypothetical protein